MITYIILGAVYFYIAGFFEFMYDQRSYDQELLNWILAFIWPISIITFLGIITAELIADFADNKKG